MKCQSCSHIVPSDFTHAYLMNSCPKCGKNLMDTNVQKLWKELNKVSAEGDLGDLAAYIYGKYINVAEDIDKTVKKPNVQEDIDAEVTFVKAPRPKNDIMAPKTDGADKINMFAKRAGIDKVKYDDLVKQIKGEKSKPFIAPSSDISEGFLDGDQDNIDASPLTAEEMTELGNMFDSDDSMSELEQVRKLDSSSGGGAFRRSF